MNYRKLYIICIWALILPGTQSKLFAQALRAEVDRNRIFIGEQIRLKLSVEGGKAGTPWFSFPDSINHILTVKKGKVDTLRKGDYINYTQTIAITSFDSGTWKFPALSLPGLANKATLPISIDVLPVDVSKMEDYNDIKDIEEVELQSNWFITVIILLITLGSIAAIYRLLQKRKKAIKVDTSFKGKLSPLEWAMAEINKLNAQNLHSPAEIKKYYSDLTDISRHFFNRQLHQHSLQQTTDEWMINLQPLAVNNEIKTKFFQFLRLADTVKFARYLPPFAEHETSVHAIKQMLQKVALLHSTVHSNYQPK